MTSEALAAATGTHGPSLYRLLRALTSIDICRERDDRSFELTPLGALLQSASAGSLRSWIIFWGRYQWPVWGHLLDSIQTGESARKLLHGTVEFQHLEQDRTMAAIFNQAMVELTRLNAQAVVRAYDFSGMQRIVDVGGGYGELLAAVLMATPGASGVLFDMPHAMEGARRHLEERGLVQRCEFMAGNFFESLPGPADAYLLKSIIHDWDDDRSHVILVNAQRAMAGRGKLLVVERIMPDRLKGSAAHQTFARSDLNMLIGPGGRERTESEFRTLMSAAGFHLTRIVPAGLAFSILEATPTE
jgi:ubiquinone/menaquinone biosynthesis C-methylase UbiE